MTFALVATISPGGATALATASGAQFGFARSMPLLAGIAIGLATLVGAAALGLGSIARALPQFELALRVAGSAYFLWLAWTIGWQGAPGSKSAVGAKPIGSSRACCCFGRTRRGGPWPYRRRARSPAWPTAQLLSPVRSGLFSACRLPFRSHSGALAASGCRAGFTLRKDGGCSIRRSRCCWWSQLH
jgi:hypothetical protein